MADALDNARSMAEMAASATGKHLYASKQAEFNSLIPKLFTVVKAWNEAEVRYTVVKMELLHDEIKRMQESKEIYAKLLKDIEDGEFDKNADEDEDPVTPD